MTDARMKIEISVDDRGKIKIKELGREIENTEKKTTRAFGNMGKSIVDMSKKIAKTALVFGTLTAAATAYAGVKIGKDLIDTGVAAQRMELQLSAATGSMEKGAQSQRYLREESERLGLVFEDQVGSYAKLAAAAKDTALEGDKINAVYTAIAESGTALQLSSEDVKGSLYAVQQMISKGTISSEELKQQLGERLPGAFATAATAMGVTTRELNKMLEQGEVVADEFLPRFAIALREKFGGAVERSAQSFGANINRIKNYWGDFKREIMASGVFKAIGDRVQGLVEKIRTLREDGTLDRWAETIGEKLTSGFNSAWSAAQSFGSYIINNKEQITAGLQSIGRAATTIANGIEKIYQGFKLLSDLAKLVTPQDYSQAGVRATLGQAFGPGGDGGGLANMQLTRTGLISSSLASGSSYNDGGAFGGMGKISMGSKQSSKLPPPPNPKNTKAALDEIRKLEDDWYQYSIAQAQDYDDARVEGWHDLRESYRQYQQDQIASAQASATAQIDHLIAVGDVEFEQRQQRLAAADAFYAQAGAHAQGWLDYELRLLDEEYRAFERAGMAKADLDRWYAQEHRRLLDEQALTHGSFVDGVVVGLRQMGEAQLTWAAQGAQAATGMFDIMASGFGNMVAVGLTNINGLSGVWSATLDTMLSKLIGTIADMATAWATAQFTQKAIPFLEQGYEKFVAPAISTGWDVAGEYASELWPFSEGAWDIHKSGPAYLHAREMVVPGEFADALRAGDFEAFRSGMAQAYPGYMDSFAGAGINALKGGAMGALGGGGLGAMMSALAGFAKGIPGMVGQLGTQAMLQDVFGGSTKFSQFGGYIGTALGSVAGPFGGIIGNLLGSMLGGTVGHFMGYGAVDRTNLIGIDAVRSNIDVRKNRFISALMEATEGQLSGLGVGQLQNMITGYYGRTGSGGMTWGATPDFDAAQSFHDFDAGGGPNAGRGGYSGSDESQYPYGGRHRVRRGGRMISGMMHSSAMMADGEEAVTPKVVARAEQFLKRYDSLGLGRARHVAPTGLDGGQMFGSMQAAIASLSDAIRNMQGGEVNIYFDGSEMGRALKGSMRAIADQNRVLAHEKNLGGMPSTSRRVL